MVKGIISLFMLRGSAELSVKVSIWFLLGYR
jgi:hypothetical protein